MKYTASVHAIERTEARYGITPTNANNWLNQLMQNASYVTTQADGKAVYHHAGRNVNIVIDTKRSVIVTVLPQHASVSNAIVDKARALLRRELTKAKRSLTKELRSVELQQAQLTVQMAQMLVNKARCRQPITRNAIQTKIDGVQAELQRLQTKQTEAIARYSVIEREAKTFIGGDIV